MKYSAEVLEAKPLSEQSKRPQLDQTVADISPGDESFVTEVQPGMKKRKSGKRENKEDDLKEPSKVKTGKRKNRKKSGAKGSDEVELKALSEQPLRAENCLSHDKNDWLVESILKVEPIPDKKVVKGKKRKKSGDKKVVKETELKREAEELVNLKEREVLVSADKSISAESSEDSEVRVGKKSRDKIDTCIESASDLGDSEKGPSVNYPDQSGAKVDTGAGSKVIELEGSISSQDSKMSSPTPNPSHPTCPIDQLQPPSIFHFQSETGHFYFEQEKVERCPTCQQYFKASQFNDHCAKLHNQCCDICSFQCLTKKDLRIHKCTAHDEEKQQLYMCDICKCLEDTRSEQNHKRIKHNITCPVCCRSFTIKNILLQHLMSEHGQSMKVVANSEDARMTVEGGDVDNCSLIKEDVKKEAPEQVDQRILIKDQFEQSGSQHEQVYTNL